MAEEQVEEKAWKSSFTEGGITYAASLFWQPLLNADNPMPEVKEAAENILEGADLYVVRRGKSTQFGLADSSQGFTRGLPAGAISLITGLGNITSFLAVFKVDNGWWYVCFRNDVILSDGDTLFANEKDAKDQFISMLAVPDWDAMYAPEEWGIEDAKSPQLSAILGKGLSVKLDKIGASNDTVMLAVIVVGFAVILWYGYTGLQSMFFSEPEAPVVAPVEQADSLAELPPEAKPWEELVNPIDMMNNCYEATKSAVELIAPGWDIEGITCNSGGLVTSWRRREEGRIPMMDQALNVSGINFLSRTLSGDGNTFMVTIPVKEMSTLNSPPEYNNTDLTNIINDLNHSLRINIATESKTWTSPRGTVYNIMGFSIQSNTDPLMWRDLLMQFSGLTINEITYDINNKSWVYKGEIYEL